MSILINKDTKLIVQGITGRDGASCCQDESVYGTNVVGHLAAQGRTAGRRHTGVQHREGCVAATGANNSIIFVPAPFAKDAMLEAIDGGIQLVVCITEGVPTLDAVAAQRYARIKVAGHRSNCTG
jgi:succinyl-CoA synthetase alpha subunit